MSHEEENNNHTQESLKTAQTIAVIIGAKTQSNDKEGNEWRQIQNKQFQFARNAIDWSGNDRVPDTTDKAGNDARRDHPEQQAEGYAYIDKD